MSDRYFVPLVALLLASAGCVASSLFPLSDGAEVVAESRMLGKWKGLSPPSTGGNLFDETYWEPGGDWTIEATPHQSFRATQREDGVTTVYAGRVVRLGSHLFLDLAPDSAETARCNLFPALLCHASFSVRFAGDTMVVGYLRSDWLESARADGRLPAGTALAFTEEDEALLTGKTPELQKILVQAAGDPRAFSIGRLLRVK
ncbi:MAG: hypothetical protein A2W00_15140 [Candidatus Eisenbacteria bacterium RBG_16_71_46]|nr:MAG: hypothetical protein A2W00_15140 [Candidatus Eisenbacteria bacterium RBG_16_71_46]